MRATDSEEPARGEKKKAAPLRVTILGATGSIGTNSLYLVAADPARYHVEALVAGSNAECLAKWAVCVGARHAVVADERTFPALKAALSGTGISCAGGADAVLEAAGRPVDRVIAAIVGTAGLAPVCAALEAGSTLALANKESLVSAGHFVMARAREKKVQILPIDSEHNALFQLLNGHPLSPGGKVILTASGGPFWKFSKAEMQKVTATQALCHPNWKMGRRITVDSATMMNKGFEVIEAFYLFSLGQTQIEVIVHPESRVHGFVQHADGSLLAQISLPDMRIPIAYCLHWPEQASLPEFRMDLSLLSDLHFEKPDPERFPALPLAFQALSYGSGAPCVLNAADEIAVEGFLDGKIGFCGIVPLVERCIEKAEKEGLLSEPTTLEQALQLDQEARRIANSLLNTTGASL